MNADEWRRLADDAPDRDRRETQTESETIQRRYLEEKWAEARCVVAELVDRIRAAAREDKRSFVLYELTCYGAGWLECYKPPYSPVVQTTQQATRGGWFRKAKPQVVEIQYVPEYAEFIFNSCPRDLNPRWEAVDEQYTPPGEPGGAPWSHGGICHGNFGGGITKGIRLWLSC